MFFNLMDNAQRYPLSSLVFNFVPDGLPMPDIAGLKVDEATANDVYRRAYHMIYGKWPKVGLGKKWQYATANAKLAQMDFKEFCLYILAGYAVTHPHSAFFAVNLTASSSLAKVESYRKACIRKFGASDARSLGLLLDMELRSIDDELLLSEISFGRYITGNIKHSGTDDCKRVYDFDEISFSPYWLAIEYTYYDFVFNPYIDKVKELPHWEKKKLGTEAQLRHRNLVSQVISVLKRRSHLASTIFTARSRIMPEAVKKVLYHHGVKDTALISDKVDIEDAFIFWRQLGHYIRDYGTIDL